MPPPPVLRKRHTLRGHLYNLTPLALKFRDHKGEVRQLARPKMNQCLDELTDDDLQKVFRDLTGDGSADMFALACKSATTDNLRLLVHLAIVYANEYGQPAGQERTTDADPAGGGRTGETSMRSPEKKARTAATSPTAFTSTNFADNGKDDVTVLRDKVRRLAMHLILLTLHDLAETARQQMHEDADMYLELSRQAHLNQGKFNIGSFLLDVLGGKASDIISKALCKSLKEHSTDEKKQGKSTPVSASPLEKLYPGYSYEPTPVMQAPGPSPPQMPYMYPQSMAMGYYMPQPRPSDYRGGAPRFPYRNRGTCLFCDSPTHLIRDCVIMKQAKPDKGNAMQYK